MPAAAVCAHRLTKRFGDTFAVRDVSFDVAPGQLVGFLGPNGAGKTTTLRILAGLFAPTSGRASVAGKDCVDDALAMRAVVGYLPEQNPLYPEMRVEEYLRLRARLHHVPPARRASAVERAIERCAVSETRRRRIGQLSKGHRQRVGLAAAIVHDPPALILDEPTSGLDPAQIIETRRLLRSLAGERTVLVSTHILPEAEKTCERVIVIARGRVCADGHPETLAAKAGPDARLTLVARMTAENEEATLRSIRAAGLPGAAVSARHADGWATIASPLPGGSAGESAARNAALESAARACAAAGCLVRELRVDAGASFESAVAALLEAPGPEPAESAR